MSQLRAESRNKLKLFMKYLKYVLLMKRKLHFSNSEPSLKCVLRVFNTTKIKKRLWIGVKRENYVDWLIWWISSWKISIIKYWMLEHCFVIWFNHIKLRSSLLLIERNKNIWITSLDTPQSPNAFLKWKLIQISSRKLK